jgi:Mat/Ecp fimbriae major subunit
MLDLCGFSVKQIYQNIFMKNSIKILAALAVLSFAGTAFAQNTATATGTANTSIIKPIALVLHQGLLFGDVVPGASAGTVTVTNGGGVSYGGGATAAGTQNPDGAPQQAIWWVTGQTGFTFNFSSPGTITYGASPAWPPGMTVTLTDLSTANPYPALTAGNNAFGEGGTLNVPANATAGAYSATWQETVNYN